MSNEYGLSSALERANHLAQQAGDEFNIEMTFEIEWFVKEALEGEYTRDFDDAIDAASGLGVVDASDAWKMVCKVAAGKCGMYEARELINKTAREYAYQIVGDTSEADRFSQHWLDVAKNVKG